MEIWRTIKGTNYKVSNMGRVKNSRGRVLKFYMSGWGYYIIDLYKNGKRTRRAYVHKLVLEAFKPNPKNKEIGNHINGIKTDNRLINLAWATASENIKHAYETGLNTGRRSYANCPF